MTSRWAVLALLCFTRATMGLQAHSVPPVTPYLVADLGLNYTQVGWLIGLFSTPGLILAMLGGLVAAQLGDRRVFLFGLVALVVGAVLFALSGGYPAALLGRGLGGVGFVLVNMLMMKTVTDHFAGRELSTAMGVLMMSWPLGISFALLALGLLAEQWGWRVALTVPAFFSVVALALVAKWLPSPAGSRPAAAEDPPAGSWPTLGETGRILIIALMWGLYNAGFTVFLGFAPSMLVAWGLSKAAASAAVSVASWVWIASLPLGGLLADRSGRPHTFIVAVALLAALLLAILPYVALQGSVWALTALIALIGLVFGAPPGAVMALPAQVMRPSTRSIGFGIFYTGNYILMASLPPLAGWVLDLTGHPAAPVWFAAGLFLFMPVLLAIFRHWTQRATPSL